MKETAPPPPPDPTRACSEDPDLPTCATGPTGRLRFVIKELAEILRRKDSAGGDAR